MKSSQPLLRKIPANFTKKVSRRAGIVAALALLAVASAARGADKVDKAAYFARIDAAKAAGIEPMDKLVRELIADAKCDADTLGWATVCLGKLDLVRALDTLPAQEARGRDHRDALAGYLLDLPGTLDRAALWLRRHPDAPQRDTIAGALALRLAWRDPPTARAWALWIKDDTKRRFALELVE